MCEGIFDGLEDEVDPLVNGGTRHFNDFVVPLRVPLPQTLTYLNRFSKSLIALSVGPVYVFPRRHEQHNFVIRKRPDIRCCLPQRNSMLLRKNAQGIHYASVEKHGVIRDTSLPVAGDIPMQNLVAELRQWRPGTQATRQALSDNGTCRLSGIHISPCCQRIEYCRLAGPWAACNDKAQVSHFSLQSLRSPDHSLTCHAAGL